MFADEVELRQATEAGELVPLSSLELPALQPRLWGHSPIAERDLELEVTVDLGLSKNVMVHYP